MPELPFLGRLDPGAVSLPVYTLVIAGLDAFNPCAFFVLLFLLPAHGEANGFLLRAARSIAFLVGAGFSASIGYLGMWLAVRANVRVAAAARDAGRDPAMIAVDLDAVSLGLAHLTVASRWRMRLRQCARSLS